MECPLLQIEKLEVERIEISKNTLSIKNTILNGGIVLPKKRIFSNISLQAFRGEIIGITGPNGVGKSTLLATIAGLFPFKSGNLVVNGRVVPLLGLGHVFKPDLTIDENVQLWYNCYSTPQAERLETDRIIEIAELSITKNTLARSLSSGMHSRLAFATAMNERADIYLLDEIFAVGDARFSRKSKAIIQDKISSGGLSIIVSHNLDMLAQNCSRVLTLCPTGLINNDLSEYDVAPSH